MFKFLVPKLVEGVISTVFFLLVFTALSISQPVFGPPVNVGVPINTSLSEYDPFLTADGQKLFFVRNAFIYYAEWGGTGWNTPVALGPHINAGASQKLSPSVSPDGQKLYYVDDSRQGFFWDIWVCTWDSSVNDWGTPVNIGQPVNTGGAEWSARLSPDGQSLYFNSEGGPRCGIYVSEWDGASWSVPVKVSVSSCAIDGYPSITADGRMLFFDRWMTATKKNVFVSLKTDSVWATPTNLLQQIGDSCFAPFIVPSGESLFFARTLGAGSFGGSDIWLAQRFQRGDLNLDGQHSITDVVFEFNKVFLNLPYPAPEEFGDMNCDFRFSIADIGLILFTVYLLRPFFCPD